MPTYKGSGYAQGSLRRTLSKATEDTGATVRNPKLKQTLPQATSIIGEKACIQSVKPLSCYADRQEVDLYEQSVCQWLKTINVHLPVDAVTGSRLGLGPPFEDPLRNGVILCTTVNHLLQLEATRTDTKGGAASSSSSKVAMKEPIKPRMVPYSKRPTTVAQARDNLENALGILRCRNIPSIYLYSTEQILKGQADIIWGLLYHVIQIIPAADAKAAPSLYVSSSRQGYTAVQSQELEQSLLRWITSLGVLHITDPPPDATTTPTTAPPCTSGQILHVPPEDMESPFISPYLRNGTLLCEIVGAIEGQRLTGVFWTPRTKGTCIANIRKAMALLRDKKGMSKWYLDTEEEVFIGDKVVILALLEDIHRFYNGIPARSGLIRKGDTPYIVAKPVIAGPIPSRTMSKSKANHSTDPPIRATEMWAALPYPSHFNSLEPPTAPPEPFLPSAQLQSSLLPSPSKLRQQHEAQTMRRDFTPYVIDPNLPVRRHSLSGMPPLAAGGDARPKAQEPYARYTSPQPYRPFQPDANDNARHIAQRVSGPSAFSRNRPAAQPPSAFVAVSPNPNQPHAPGGTSARQSPSDTIPTDGSVVSESARAQILTKWLQFLGISPPPPLVGDRLDAFCDGTLLCHIVSILSHQTLQGVEWNPKSRASMKHNIEKALEVLEKNKHITLDWLFLCEDLLDGKPAAVLSLLTSMKRAYHFFVSTVAKSIGDDADEEPVPLLQGTSSKPSLAPSPPPLGKHQMPVSSKPL